MKRRFQSLNNIQIQLQLDKKAEEVTGFNAVSPQANCCFLQTGSFLKNFPKIKENQGGWMEIKMKQKWQKVDRGLTFKHFSPFSHLLSFFLQVNCCRIAFSVAYINYMHAHAEWFHALSSRPQCKHVNLHRAELNRGVAKKRQWGQIQSCNCVPALCWDFICKIGTFSQ